MSNIQVSIKTGSVVSFLQECMNKYPEGKDINIKLSDKHAKEVQAYLNEFNLPALYVTQFDHWATFSVAKDLETLDEHERLR